MASCIVQKFYVAALMLGAMSDALSSPQDISQDEVRRQQICRQQAEIYMSAAWYRDQGIPPQTAADGQAAYIKSGVAREFIKQAVNQVYFDDRFANAGGSQFKEQMFTICVTGKSSRFEPLK